MYVPVQCNVVTVDNGIMITIYTLCKTASTMFHQYLLEHCRRSEPISQAADTYLQCTQSQRQICNHLFG